jgi:hypothetical protein
MIYLPVYHSHRQYPEPNPDLLLTCRPLFSHIAVLFSHEPFFYFFNAPIITTNTVTPAGELRPSSLNTHKIKRQHQSLSETRRVVPMLVEPTPGVEMSNIPVSAAVNTVLFLWGLRSYVITRRPESLREFNSKYSLILFVS